MSPLATSSLAAGSLVGGYAVAAGTGVRPLGGLVLLGAAVVCGREWHREAGPATAGGLLGLYAGAFVASHPLAKSLGAWPSVLTVAGVVGVASYALTRTRVLTRA